MSKPDKSGASENGKTAALAQASGPPGNDSTERIQNLNCDDSQCETIASSSCGDHKGRVPEMARPLRLQCRDCEELLHELSNVITPILMHAQMLEWKLPPYSHLKRPVREMERNARRGGELVKALMRRCGEVEMSSMVGELAIDPNRGRTFPEEARRPHKRM